GRRRVAQTDHRPEPRLADERPRHSVDGAAFDRRRFQLGNRRPLILVGPIFSRRDQRLTSWQSTCERDTLGPRAFERPPQGGRHAPWDEGGTMRTLLVAAALALAGSSVMLAQSHTIVALGHGDFSVNELDPSSGAILHVFTAANQPHEAAISPDGKTIYASVPQAGHGVILDPATFKEKGRIETPFFHGRTPRPASAQAGRGRGRGAADAEGGEGRGRGNARQGVSSADSSSPHGMGLNADGSKLYIGVEAADVPGVV